MTDVCKDGNLLKVNSCNCAGKLDEAKEGVNMVSVSIPGKEIVKEKRRALQSEPKNKHLLICIVWRGKKKKEKLGFTVKRGSLEMGGDGVTFEFCDYVQWDVNNQSALINSRQKSHTQTRNRIAKITC